MKTATASEILTNLKYTDDTQTESVDGADIGRLELVILPDGTLHTVAIASLPDTV
jgi:hypothetical protein